MKVQMGGPVDAHARRQGSPAVLASVLMRCHLSGGDALKQVLEALRRIPTKLGPKGNMKNQEDIYICMYVYRQTKSHTYALLHVSF